MIKIKFIIVIVLALIIARAGMAQSVVYNNEIFTGTADVTATQQVVLQEGFRAMKGSTVHVYIDANTKDNDTYTVDTGSTPSGTPSSGQNYIRTMSMLVPYTGPYAQNYKRIETEQYYNGLGKPIQTVVMEGSPDNNDIVTPVAYDSYGRQTGQYLPYVDNSNNGAFVSNAINECINYYRYEFPTGRESDTRPYSVINYENSPLNRVLGETPIGSAWSTKPTSITYATNASSVISWDESGDAKTYASGQLYVTTFTDEDGHQTREYKDKQGRVVLKESKDGSYWRKTHYVFDKYGLLRIVVPPKATGTDQPGLVYKYTYDSKRRMVTKILPGGNSLYMANTIYMVYDARDRLVMTRDGNMAENGKWLATVYDAFNRPVITALVSGSSPSSVTSLFASVTGSASYNSGSIFGYSVPSQFGITESNVQTVVYYDNYDFISRFGSGYTYVDPDLANNPSSNSTQVKGFVTGTLNRVIEGSMADNLLLSVNYYDEYGRVIRTISDNHLGEKDVVYTDYNFAGEPEQVTLRHNISGTTEDIKLTTNYVYDHQGRLLTEKMQVDNEDEICIAAYSYNDLGEVIKKYLHGNSSNQYFNQVVDYTYNVKGWLKKINNIGSLDDDLFAFELRYENPGPNNISAPALYNGNISGMMWQTVSDAAPKGYGFEYDGLNRLSQGGYADGSSFNQHVNYNYANYGYDTNGNLNFIERRLNGTIASGGQIDDLAYYFYSSSNQISHVNDYSGNPLGYHDNDGTNITYQYDANGNLFRDYSKGIEISYNYLNLPDYIDFGDDDEISYYYTADGTKVRKDVVGANSENSVVVDYVGPFIYENDELKAIFTSEGRIVPFVSGSDVLYKYEYNLKDHLGNTRVMFAGHSNGQPELMQTSEYYPFGMVMNKQNYFGEAEMENDYLYNGKEQQNDELSGVSLDWYDFHARFYDAALGRTTTQDPHAENYYSESSYSFMGNNPIVNVDPTGMDWFYYKKEGEEDASWNWHKGSEYNHTYTYTEDGEEKTGNIALQGSEYLVEYSITGTNDEGSSVGTINVFKQQDIVASQDGVFTGTNQYSGTAPADKGTYFMALNIRDADGPQKMNADESNPEAAWGMQKIPNNTIIPMRSDPTRGYSINASYGNGRVRLIPSEQVSNNNLLRYGYKDRGLYLHGKKDPHNWTHGCVCDKSGSIFNYLWNNVRKRTPFVVK